MAVNSATDVLNFETRINGTQKVKVLVTVKSEYQKTKNGSQVTYTVTNDKSANTNVSWLSVAGDRYFFNVATAQEVLPGEVGTVTVIRPDTECQVTSEGSLAIEFPTLGLGEVEYEGIRVCALAEVLGQ